MTTSKSKSPATRDAVVPDAVLPAYDPPAYLVPQDQVRTADSVTSLADLAATLVASYNESKGAAEHTMRRFARDTVAVWANVGMIVEQAWRIAGGKDGAAVAADESPTWAKIKNAACTAVIAKRVGYSLDSLSRMWDAYRSDTPLTFGRWQDYCDQPSVAASDPDSFVPTSAVSAVRWSVAHAVKGKDGLTRTDSTGAVIKSGSNRGPGGKALRKGTTVAASRAQAQAERKLIRDQVAKDVKSDAPPAIVTDLRPIVAGLDSLAACDAAEATFRLLVNGRRATLRKALKDGAAPVTSTTPDVDAMTSDQAQALLVALAAKLGVTA